MEKLATNVSSEVSVLYPSQCPKDFYLSSSQALAALANQVLPTSPYFGLFLAADAREVKALDIGRLAQALVPRGLAYLCAWGPDCERVHDCFDEVLNESVLEPTEDNVVMTTWHDDESLEEALWYFMNSAFATKAYATTCRDWVIAVVGNQGWEDTIRSYIRLRPASDCRTID
jgi:hypothetical protein